MHWWRNGIEGRVEEINAKLEILATASMKMGEAMNAAAAESENPADAAKSASDDDSKVVDGEFKDVSEEDK